MDLEKQILIAKGTIKHIPGVKRLLSPLKTGGTNESRYCYSIWLRHLHFWSLFKKSIPFTVAELGPGDSPGTGLAALLSGANHLYSLDVIKYWDDARNLRIFDELVMLFRRRAMIPDNSVYPRVKPALDNYNFPSNILTDKIIDIALAKERVEAIREEIKNINHPGNTFIKIMIPWHDSGVIESNSVDFIYSQAVLECIDDLDGTYNAMCRWLKQDGLMSHTIDFKSHGLTKEWNGHWKFSEKEWRLVKGGRSFLVNRQPLSKHLKMHDKHGFEIIVRKQVKAENKVRIGELPLNFRNLSEEDMTTSGVYLLSKKSRECNHEKDISRPRAF